MDKYNYRYHHVSKFFSLGCSRTQSLLPRVECAVPEMIKGEDARAGGAIALVVTLHGLLAMTSLPWRILLERSSGSK
jgi:hypothetical protein